MLLDTIDCVSVCCYDSIYDNTQNDMGHSTLLKYQINHFNIVVV